MRKYEQQHPQESLHLAYFGSVDPALYGVRSMPISGQEQPNGPLIVGATCLSGQVLQDPAQFQWLWARPPRQILDGSMWLYDLDKP